MRSYRFEPPSEPLSRRIDRAAASYFRLGRPVPHIVAVLLAGCGFWTLIRLAESAAPLHQPAGPPAWSALLPRETRSIVAAEILAGFAMVLASIHLWSGSKRALRAAGALSAAVGYVAVGLRLFESQELGPYLVWPRAAARSIRAVLLLGDAGLTAHNLQAAWFLDSLRAVSICTYAYCGLALLGIRASRSPARTAPLSRGSRRANMN